MSNVEVAMDSHGLDTEWNPAWHSYVCVCTILALSRDSAGLRKHCFSPKYDVQKYHGLPQSGNPLARIQRTCLTVLCLNMREGLRLAAVLVLSYPRCLTCFLSGFSLWSSLTGWLRTTAYWSIFLLSESQRTSLGALLSRELWSLSGW